MNPRTPRGLFVTGTDTDVGKTYVTALIARDLRALGIRVGVYKPVASGCIVENGRLVSEDARTLWNAAGQPGDFDWVCPQCFEAPLAPNLAARAEGTSLDWDLFVEGFDYWHDLCEVVLVEGAGGLMCPLGDDLYVADLAAVFRLPLLIVARNALGTINHTLQTLITASVHRDPLRVAGIVLNRTTPPDNDASVATNRSELAQRCEPPVLAEVGWRAAQFEPEVDWTRLFRR